MKNFTVAFVCSAGLLVASCAKTPDGSADTRLGTPSGADTPSAVGAPPTPTPQRVVGTPLGEPAWISIVAAPDRSSLAAGHSRGLDLVSLPDRTRRWRIATTFASDFVAFSADGTTVAALGSDRDNKLRLLVVNVVDGATVSDRTFPGLSSPSVEHGIQPPARATGLAPARGTAGFWIFNAYGITLVAPGAKALVPVKSSKRFTGAAQDGKSYWHPTKDALTSGTGVTIPMPCYPQQFTIATDVDRVASICAPGRGQPTTVRFAKASTGELVREVQVEAYPRMAIVDGDTLALLSPAPRRFGWWTTTGVDWRALPVGAGVVSLSPSGNRAAAASASALTVFDLPSGQIRCDQSVIQGIAIGFTDEDTAWVLGYEPDVNNRLRLDKLTIPGCKVSDGRSLDLGKTTNLAPIWLAEAGAFAFNGLYGKGEHGPVLVPVAAGAAPTPLASGTPAFGTDPMGRHLGFVEHGSKAALYQVSPTTKELTRFKGKVAQVALCGDRVLSYRYSEGWTQHAADGSGAKAPFLKHPQPDRQTCRGDTLLIGRGDKIFVVDLRTETVTKVIQLDRRVGSMTILPGERQVLLSGGPTAWQLMSLREVAR